MSSGKYDTRLKNLIEEINSLPGIQTITSCGGHKKPDITQSQVPENEFYVVFGFKTQYPTKEAWESLNVIAQLISGDSIYERDGFSPDTCVKMEVYKDEFTTIFFRLYGRNVDPEVVREILVQAKKPSKYIKTMNPKIPHDKLKFPRMTKEEETTFFNDVGRS